MCLFESMIGLTVETLAREGMCKKLCRVLTECATGFPRLPLAFAMDKRSFLSAIATDFFFIEGGASHFTLEATC